MCGPCGTGCRSYYDSKTRLVRDLASGEARIYLEVAVRRVSCRRCGKVKREWLEWLSENPFYTKRLVWFVGRRGRSMSIKDVHLDWHTVKRLEKPYMEEQLRRTGLPAPQVIGIDEISLRKGHTYRIVVSDVERRHPLWFGGHDRSAESLDSFYIWLGDKKGGRDPARGDGHVEGL